LYPTCGICAAAGLFVCGKPMLICALVLILVHLNGTDFPYSFLISDHWLT